MKCNPLQHVGRLGQSTGWDYTRRDVTANGSDYYANIRALALEGKGVDGLTQTST